MAYARLTAKQRRGGRDSAESDRIRDELAARGVLLEDQPGGATRWRRA
jgi:cysteinyl-tRNA synthetase